MLLYFTGLTSTGSECIQKNSDLQCDPIIRKYGIKPQGLTSYILTLEEQRKNDYPIKGQFWGAFGWLLRVFLLRFLLVLISTVVVCLVI